MKRFLILAVSVIICASACCGSENYDGDGVRQKPDDYGSRFSFRGHDYFRFYSGNQTYCIVHDPDCRNCIKYKENDRYGL